jgi:NADPH2:quinone reductase
MIALQYARFGEPSDVAEPAEIPIPEPGAGEVRLRLIRSPIHNHDLATIRGTYGIRPTLPAVGGSEMLGVVDALGANLTNVRVGTRVACVTRGAWAEYALAPAASLITMPDALTDEVACQLLAMPASAYVLFDELRTQPGMWIVQNAAGGAVGRILMRLAQSRGVHVINLVRREDTASELRALGAEHVVVTERASWPDEVRALAPEGVARIVDSVAGPQTIELQRLLAKRGELIVFGALSRSGIKLDPSLMISQETTVRGFWMTAWSARASVEARAAAMHAVIDAAMKGELPLAVAATYSLSDAKDALAAAETPGRAGKVLFRSR